MKLNVGFTQKIGLPNYSSRGASCHIELELDSTLLQSDREAFQWHVRNAFDACQQAVQEELLRNAAAAAEPPIPNGHQSRPPARHVTGRLSAPHANRPQGRMRPATENQIRAINKIAGEQQVDLEELLRLRFGVAQPQKLGVRDASSLIDELNAREASPRWPRIAGQ